MDDFTLIANGVLTFAIALIVFILKTVIWGSIQSLKAESKELRERLVITEKLVIGEYVTRSEFHDFVTGISDKLDMIIKELGEKQDR